MDHIHLFLLNFCFKYVNPQLYPLASVQIQCRIWCHRSNSFTQKWSLISHYLKESRFNTRSHTWAWTPCSIHSGKSRIKHTAILWTSMLTKSLRSHVIFHLNFINQLNHRKLWIRWLTDRMGVHCLSQHFQIFQITDWGRKHLLGANHNLNNTKKIQTALAHEAECITGDESQK